MEEYLKNGYTLVISRQLNNELIGGYNLTRQETLMDFKEATNSDLSILNAYDKVQEHLIYDKFLVLSYNQQAEVYKAKFLKKVYKDPFLEEVVYDIECEQLGSNINHALTNLNQSFAKQKEGGKTYAKK